MANPFACQATLARLISRTTQIVGSQAAEATSVWYNEASKSMGTKVHISRGALPSFSSRQVHSTASFSQKRTSKTHDHTTSVLSHHIHRIAIHLPSDLKEQSRYDFPNLAHSRRLTAQGPQHVRNTCIHDALSWLYDSM